MTGGDYAIAISEHFHFLCLAKIESQALRKIRLTAFPVSNGTLSCPLKPNSVFIFIEIKAAKSMMNGAVILFYARK